MKSLLRIGAILALAGLAACDITTGDCHLRGSDDGSGDVGSGVVNSTGPGNPGDNPSDTLPTADCNAPDPSSPGSDGPPPPAGQGGGSSASGAGGAGGGSLGSEMGAPTAGDSLVFCDSVLFPECATGEFFSFSSSLFVFKTTIPDDGKDAGGGYQEATANLKFWKWTGLFPKSWSCPISVGMPIRTHQTTITPTYAASISAAAATVAAEYVDKEWPDLPPGIFCSKHRDRMNWIFEKVYPRWEHRHICRKDEDRESHQRATVRDRISSLPARTRE